MLKLMRNKKVTKFILWGTLILILPAFVIWGAGNVSKSKSDRPKFAGIIDDRKISFEDFAASLTAVRCQIFLNYFYEPKILESLLKNNEFMGKLAWDMLIMAREAKKRSIKASDQEVVTFIRTHPLFNRNGQFDNKIYEYVLKNNLGMDARTFEEIVRDNFAIQKLNNILTANITVTDQEVNDVYRIENEKFRASYALLGEGEDDANNSISKIRSRMDTDKLSFEQACKIEGLETKTTEMFSKSDYIDGVGEAVTLVEAAIKTGDAATSGPVKTRKGILVMKVIENQGIDEQKYKAEKDEFAKKVLVAKKNAYLEDWLRRLEVNTKINIDLKDYEKYYK